MSRSDVLFEDNNLCIHTSRSNKYPPHFVVKNNWDEFFYFKIADGMYYNLNFKKPKEIVDYCIQKLKSILNKEPKYIPTIMRLTALRETL